MKDLDYHSETDGKSGLEDYPLREWLQELEEATSSLGQVVAGREDEFLEIGQGVQDLSVRSRELSSCSMELAEKASGKTLKEDMQEMDRALEQIQDKSESVDLSLILGRCTDLAGAIAKLHKEMQQFRPMLKHLRVLAMSIRIESARLGEAGRHFVTLAQEVEKLGHKTDEYSRHVGRRATDLLGEVQKVQDRVDMTQKLHSGEITPLLDRFCQGNQDLKELQSSSERISSSISSRTEDIKEQIGEIISSVQFHDITRQQVEHVQQSLEEVQIFFQGDPGRQQDDAAGMISWLNDVCSLQYRQLTFTKSELGSAMDRIRESIAAIGRFAAEQEKDMDGFAGLDSGSGKGVLGELEQDASELIPALQQASTRFEDVVDRLDGMAGVLGDMQNLLDTLEDIGEEIELIALNASVKSAHTGDEGKPLGVLAGAIHRLSRSTKDLVARVSGVLEEIVSVSGDFNSHAASARARAQKEAALCETLGQVLNRLAQSNSEAAALHGSLRRDTAEFLKLVRSLEDKMDLQFVVEKELSSIIQHLQRIQGQVSDQVPEYAEGRYSERLKNSLHRYTMQSERSVFLEFTGEGQAAGKNMPDDNIDLFDEDAGEDEDGFGENVELF